ncbi:MAG: RIP metalloprotease RseP [Planctomycetes bacterium]|nr:RIP metalloprotease RseP [Planctomycetota bacterium]
MSSLYSGILTVLAFGAIIFIHELGHYLAARRVGIRVEKFYLGFDFWGMKLLKFHYNNTEYGIGIFPFGGYVKMAGQEDMGKAVVSGKDDEFPAKSVWQRIQVLFAGVFFNFLSAFVFSLLAVWCGYELTTSEVGDIAPGNAAWKSELKVGDTIVKYNGYPIDSFSALRTEVALSHVGEENEVEVLREGKRLSLSIVPELGSHGMASIGVYPSSTLKLRHVSPNSPAMKAGFKPGDTILTIDGQSISKWKEISPLVNKAGKEERQMVVKIKRAEEEMTLKAQPQLRKKGFLGLSPRLPLAIEDVQPRSAAEKVGITKGMKFLSINGVDAQDAFWKIPKDAHGLALTLLDDEKEVEFQYPGRLDDLEYELLLNSSPETIIVQSVQNGHGAEKMGLQSGDEILSLQVDGEKMVEKPQWAELLAFVSHGMGKGIQMKVKRGSLDLSLTGTIGQVNPEGFNSFSLGVVPMIKNHENPTLSSVMLWPVSMLRLTLKSFVSLVRGKVSSNNLAGPLGIISTTYEVASSGLPYLFYLMAFISINLAVLNLLPIPALDGGHLMFCLIELIKGGPVNENIMYKMQVAGMLFLLGLILFATFNDLNNFIL